MEQSAGLGIENGRMSLQFVWHRSRSIYLRSIGLPKLSHPRQMLCRADLEDHIYLGAPHAAEANPFTQGDAEWVSI
jgi:hypothetical protein